MSSDETDFFKEQKKTKTHPSIAVAIAAGRRGFRGRKTSEVKNEGAADLFPKQLHRKLTALLKYCRFIYLFIRLFSLAESDAVIQHLVRKMSETPWSALFYFYFFCVCMMQTLRELLVVKYTTASFSIFW